MSRKPENLWNPEARELLRAVTRLETVSQARKFMRDLMTEDEIRMIVERWRVARMLHEGRSYREIAEATGSSSRTIARISHWLQDGEGGYRAMLSRPATPRAAAAGKAVDDPHGGDGGLSAHRRRPRHP